MDIDREKKADDIIEKLCAKLDAQVYAELDAGPLLVGTTKTSFSFEIWEQKVNQVRGNRLARLEPEAFTARMGLMPAGQMAILGFQVIEVQPSPIYSQARAHKRHRVNKKWLKRYGLKRTGWDYFLGEQLIVDKTRGAIYCHPEVAARLRYELAKPRIGCRNCNRQILTPTEGQPDPLNRAAWDFPPSTVMGGPARGEYTCDNCGAVNEVARTITGGTHVILLSTP